MLKKFTLKNYKNFKNEIKIDFADVAGYQFSSDCIYNDLISKMLIYGRNATGKTNFGYALMDIYFLLSGRLIHDENTVYLNADSSEDCAKFLYNFQFEDKELTYRYDRFDTGALKEEELMLEGVSVFKCDFANRKYCFDNLVCINSETANIDNYLESVDENGSDVDCEPVLPFLRWVLNNVAFPKESVLIRLKNYVDKMRMLTLGNSKRFRKDRLSSYYNRFMQNNKDIKGLEEFLNHMGIECKLVLESLPDGREKMYFDYERLVPFYETASSGTLALVDMYYKIVSSGVNSSFLYLDEFDAFYHYEMAENVMGYFKKKYPQCQVIMTSHNTNLMTNRLMRPDCMFIISKDCTLTPLCNATERELREGHNLEKMYISGEFEKYE